MGRDWIALRGSLEMPVNQVKKSRAMRSVMKGSCRLYNHVEESQEALFNDTF
jgi:hypothetical protein